MNWINSWRKGNKQDDIILIQLRFGRISVLDLRYDASAGKGRFVILNFGISW